ncbi:beta-ketoacyl synthase [Leclercia sp. 29361]|uniref:beta-ketoacyl synthase N-terminal-like domain-containing protein n=1 Tax=Leclercia sp. 29361 TaxID=2714951 RepID=UPI00140B601C|nr:beta-ketoacyl synthase N-terminal-like domain-containing protein [Leclercia sp. 29361]QIK12801.1 beta-ketoacyl synthase [Leclercia sp. 29361]
MDRTSIISGYSVYLPFADSSTQLINNLKRGERVLLSPWFKSDTEAIKCGFNGNKQVAKLQQVKDSDVDLLYRLIDNALLQAGLDESCLAGENVRVYLTGIGPRVDWMDYKAFYDQNDVEDIKCTPSIAHLCVANMSQDNLSRTLAKRYSLKYLPPNLNCTSNSALTAIHLSSQAIERGGIDLALVINISKIKTQDIWFLSTQSMLDSSIVQPFGRNSKGVNFAEGYSVLLLESSHYRQARYVSGGVRIKSLYNQINASRSFDASWQSTSMLKLINKLLKDSEIEIDDLCAFIPHGNGAEMSDCIEAKTISLLAGDRILPVLAYKGQIGYTATGSGLIDLIIGDYTLTHREIITPIKNDDITEDIARHVLQGKTAIQHNKTHLLKTGMGVDGSMIAVLLTNTDKD